jgi:tryptophan 2-monooxygenase
VAAPEPLPLGGPLPDLGRVVPGAVADLTAVRGDPFTDIMAMGRVGLVMQSGRVVHRPAA